MNALPFDPVAGFVGGLMIGLASGAMLLGLGHIAGVSGLAARATGLAPAGAPWGVAAAFVLGLPLGTAVLTVLLGPVEARFPPVAALVVGGLLVGFGTRLGSGCTSGHGVSGLSRLSSRSMVAVASFMGAGFASVAGLNALGLGW